MKRALLRFEGLGILGALGAVVAVAGCGRVDDSAFEGSVPLKETVAAVLPGSATTTRESARRGMRVTSCAQVARWAAAGFVAAMPMGDFLHAARLAINGHARLRRSCFLA